MATKVASLAKRATQHATQTARRAAAVSGGAQMDQLRTHITWLSGQIRDVDDNLASMKHDYAEMGERSDWVDPRLAQLDETITFWTHRYQALQAQRTAARAQLVTLQANATAAATTATTTATTVAKAPTTRHIPDIYAGQRGAQPIVREAW